MKKNSAEILIRTQLDLDSLYRSLETIVQTVEERLDLLNNSSNFNCLRARGVLHLPEADYKFVKNIWKVVDI